MHVDIRRIDTELSLPEYKTEGAVAMDCAARVDTVIPARGIAYVPLNIGVKPPKGYTVIMAARSSLHKKGLLLPNAIGIFDEDFSGDDDEYHAVVYNFTDAEVTVARGDRITQIIVLPFDRVTWNEVATHGVATRGGFGSTGV
ncbi:MAG: dUTP pyrophosphatase [Parcubacteria bacterium C7867-001]|nr:MAG: dUTP pyrophosphatase [Parcubacteria bacterium C7867-001]